MKPSTSLSTTTRCAQVAHLVPLLQLSGSPQVGHPVVHLAHPRHHHSDPQLARVPHDTAQGPQAPAPPFRTAAVSPSPRPSPGPHGMPLNGSLHSRRPSCLPRHHRKCLQSLRAYSPISTTTVLDQIPAESHRLHTGHTDQTPTRGVRTSRAPHAAAPPERRTGSLDEPVPHLTVSPAAFLVAAVYRRCRGRPSPSHCDSPPLVGRGGAC